MLALLGWIPSIVVMTGLVAWSGLEGLLNLTLAFEPAALAWFFVHPGRAAQKITRTRSLRAAVAIPS